MSEHRPRQNEHGLVGYDTILIEIAGLVAEAQRQVAQTVNTAMTSLYWLIGCRIVESEQGGELRAGYGEELIERLAGDLSARFGRGFSMRNLWHMKAFYLAWPQASGHRIPQRPSADSEVGDIPQTASAESAALDRAPCFLLPWLFHPTIMPL